MSIGVNPATEPLFELLTRREREILCLLAQGNTAPEIAQALTLGLSTVKWHLAHVYSKLGVNNKRQALKRARALDLLFANDAAAPTESLAASVPTARKHNLPLQVTHFFGRADEIVAIDGRLTEWRLVTLTGSGGVGKTRLAMRVAERHLDDFPHGVWLVELAPVSDSTLVAQSVATVLGVRDGPGHSTRESLVAYLRERQLLLLLDNCEHLLDACAHLVEALLSACPHVQILATSREPLTIAGEAIYPVPSLSFPDPGHVPAPDSLLNYDAVRLFVNRAGAQVPGYRVADDNAAALARICQRLDGIPLALEMAAARISLLTTEQLAARLDDAFAVLTRGSSTAVPRHQTLRATLDWSYRLLSDEQQILLQRLSIFAGGCTLEAAEAVCAYSSPDHGPEAGQVLDVLGALVAKSMVIAGHPPGEVTRYRLLEIVRQYAAEKLETTGETARMRTRHADYFLTFAESNVPRLRSRDRLVYARRIIAERGNLRLALDWLITGLASGEAGIRLILSAFPEDMASTLWSYGEVWEWHRKGLDLCRHPEGISLRLHAALLSSASNVTALNDPYTALTLAQKAVALSRRLGAEGKDCLMRNLSLLGWRYLVDLADYEHAVAPYAESEAILNELGPAVSPEMFAGWQAWLSYVKGILAERQGQFETAKNHAIESVRLFEVSGDRWATTEPRILLGLVCRRLGENDAARTHLLKALGLNAESGRRFQAHILCSLGFVDLDTGNLPRALDYAEASVLSSDAAADHNILALSIGLMASIWAKRLRANRAARLAGASHALFAWQKRKPSEDTSLDTLLPGWREGPDQAAIQDAYDAGQAMTSDEVVAWALNDSYTPA